MKKLILSLLFVPLLTYAQVQMEASKPISCYTLDYIKGEMEKAQESPIILSENSMTKSSAIAVFYNENTGTWTVVEFAKTFGCVLGFGTDKQTKI
jgi:hypothetical protein